MRILILLIALAAVAQGAAPIQNMPIAEEPSPATLLDIWKANLRRFGDTEKARAQTLDEIRHLGQVVEAGLSKQHTGIWVRFRSGAVSGFVLRRD